MRGKRSKSLFDVDKHTLEFSPGQLVMAICTILLLGLVSFLVGVLVGRHDHSYTDARLFSLGDERTAEERSSHGADREPEGEGVQVSPRPIGLPGDSTGDGRVRSTELPAPPGLSADARQRDATPRPSRGREREPVPPAFEDANDAPEESEPAEEPEEPAEDPEEPDEPEEESTPPEDEVEESLDIEPLTVDDEESPASASGPYSIQVVAYSAADRTKAAAYAREIQSRTNINTQVAQSEDGQHLRIFVGSYPDRESAERVLEELKDKDGFEESFVRTRSNAS